MGGVVKHIQMICDEMVMLLAVSRAYRDNTVNVVAATNIEEALTQTQTYDFSLFLLDLDIKDGCAFQVLEWMTRHFPDRPALLMTTADSQSAQLVEKINEVRPQSCWHILEKPFVYKKLVGFIDSALQLAEESFDSDSQYQLSECLERRHCHRILRFARAKIPCVTDTGLSSLHHPLFANLVDISIGGMSVTTDEALVPGETIYFDETFMHQSGTVVWCRLQIEHLYHSGIKFS
ncbi:PilZ domain-containing protein [Desulfuromusa kysingii]|uniref:PilZ domain-containing protein n=1 Tax=Desulfuromusa kysingii TaxID=37625 RepID=A0A1H3VQN5_9BACT|nr:response regulator [Desulfuromusa kysingii]SDZ77123.1 PilZ domain-containing protein [Desulfuromusa kysingii]